MLQELHIESLGVIEQLDLVLGPGLTALTGETGAGKTLLVEAISLLVGGRADATMVRPGAIEARVEGRFVVGDDEYVVARVVPADGRSRAYVNGRLATVGNLAELGARFVDLHGQHSHQSLLSAAEQRDALDRYCRTDLGPLRAARARLTELDAALAALGGDSKSRARELDLLRFQSTELRAAAIASSREDADLEAELDELAGAVEYRELGNIAVGALSDDGGAGDSITAAVRALGGRAPFAELESRLRGLAAEVHDVAADLRRRAEDIEEDPERLDAVRGRLQLLRDLRRKYGDTLAEVIGFHDEVEQRLAELEGYEGRVADLERERVEAVAAERSAAAAVGRARRAGAGALADEVQHHLRELAMPHATVAVTVGQHDPGDEVSFLLAANPGTPLLPLARVASGGELARTMLALRLVLTEAPDTLVFDEVDAGIGGSAAVAVGRNLAALCARHQVLVVTHLAQVAALAHTHVVVSKRGHDGATLTPAAGSAGQDRVAEVARRRPGARRPTRRAAMRPTCWAIAHSDPPDEAAQRMTELELDRGVSSGFRRDTILVTVCTLLSRVTGFGRVVATAAVLGVGVLGDVYQTANMIPNLLFELVAGGVLQAVLVPSFVAARRDGGNEALSQATQATAGVIVAGLALVAAVGMAISPLVARLLVLSEPSRAVSREKLDVMVPMVLVFVPQLVSYGIATVTSAALNAKGRYVAAAVAPAVNNVIVIIACVVFRAMRGGEVADLDLTVGQFAVIAGGTTLGVLAFSLTPALALNASGVRWLPRWRPHHPAVTTLRRSFGWATLSIVGTLVPTAAALALGNGAPGGVAVFVYAFAFYVLPHALIAVTIATTLAPRVAEGWQAGRVGEVRSAIDGAMRTTVPLLALAGSGMVALAWPLTRLVAGVGQTSSQGLAPIAHTLAAFGPGLLGYGVAFIMTRVLFALGDVRRASLLMIAGAVVGVVSMTAASALMAPADRAAALAIGYGASQAVAAVLLTMRVHRLTGSMGGRRAARLTAESLLSAVVASLLMAWIAGQFDTTRPQALAAFLVAGTAGVATFTATVALLRGGELLGRSTGGGTGQPS